MMPRREVTYSHTNATSRPHGIFAALPCITMVIYLGQVTIAPTLAVGLQRCCVLMWVCAVRRATTESETAAGVEVIC